MFKIGDTTPTGLMAKLCYTVSPLPMVSSCNIMVFASHCANFPLTGPVIQAA